MPIKSFQITPTANDYCNVFIARKVSEICKNSKNNNDSFTVVESNSFLDPYKIFRYF